jgi:hypothetical protein
MTIDLILHSRRDIPRRSYKSKYKHYKKNYSPDAAVKSAEEVGISKTAIYRHYKSKRKILSFIIDNFGDIITRDICSVLKERNTPLKRLDGVLKRHLSAIE